MSATLDLCSQRLFEVLVNASCAVLVVMVLVWVGLRLAGGISAAARSMVWASALGASLFLPVLLAFMPANWRLQAPGLGPIAAETRMVSHPTEASPAASPAGIVPTTASPELPGAKDEMVRPPEPSADVVRLAIYGAVAIWFAGALCVGGRFVLGNILLGLRCRTGRPSSREDWQSAARAVANQLGVNDDVRLWADDRTRTPAVWGFRRATIFVPLLADWSLERKRIVLLHEFAHIKRRDPQTLWRHQLVAALYWFHPAVLLALNENRMACEQACDDMVLDTGVAPCEYASHLLEISEDLPASLPVYACVSLLGTQSLERRVVSILNASASRRRPHRHDKIAVVGALLSLIALLAIARPLATEEEQPKPIVTVPSPVPSSQQLSPPAAQREHVPATQATSDVATHPDHASAAREQTSPILHAPEPVAAPQRSTASESIHATPPSAMPKAEVQPAVVTTGPVPSENKPTENTAAPKLAATGKVDVGVVAVPAEPSRVVVREGTPLQLSYAESLNTKSARVGETVKFVLMADLRVDGRVVAKSGAVAVGTIVTVVKAKPPGGSGALALRLDYLQVGAQQVKLSGPKNKNEGEIRYTRAFALKWPFGVFRPGDELDIAKGTKLEAYVSNNIELFDIGSQDR